MRQPRETPARVLASRAVAATAALALSGVLSCDGGGGPLAAALTAEDAAAELDSIISDVEMPDLSENVGTTSLNQFQRKILEGHDYPSTPGLVDARVALQERDVAGFCQRAGSIITNTFVNNIMEQPAQGVAQLTPSDGEEHDPQRLFLGRNDAEITMMGSPVVMPRHEVGLEGDVVSTLWKDDALALMDIVYGLGQQCVDAAKIGKQ